MKNGQRKALRLLAALCALLLSCGSLASAEEALHQCLARIGDQENPAVYTIATAEYGEMKPTADYVPFFAELLKDAKLTPVSAAQAPKDVCVVLSFPEAGLRFDFFEKVGEHAYVRQVNADGSEELFEITMPETTLSTPAGLMSAAADTLAEETGMLGNVWAELPEEGWVLDSLNGFFWQDDRASLAISLDDMNQFRVVISWGASAWDAREWTYTCDYESETRILRARHVRCEDIHWDDQGNESRTVVFETACEAVFALNEEGRLVISNAGDEQLEGKTFAQVDLLEEAAGEPEA